MEFVRIVDFLRKVFILYTLVTGQNVTFGTQGKKQLQRQVMNIQKECGGYKIDKDIKIITVPESWI